MSNVPQRRNWKLMLGDCVDVMAEMNEHSVDSIVTDPPYGLKFMGKGWDDTGHGNDQQAWHYRWAVEALRVLKPGGHLVAFGGTRTYHRLVSAVEDAGFEIRDQVQWLYGQGFPKSMNVSKAIDKRKDWAERTMTQGGGTVLNLRQGDTHEVRANITAAATPEAAQWEGWGTALKPAHEPIVVARKPLIGTVAANVLEHGTGALNIDATRISPGHDNGTGRDGEPTEVATYADEDVTNFAATPGPRGGAPGGRFPANVILDEEAGAMLDDQTGVLKSGGTPPTRFSDKARTTYGTFLGEDNPEGIGSTEGGASRFFYCAKASKSEREAGLTPPEGEKRANTHPTVKPIALMAYLVRLVTPPGGIVLDPFVGSGSTGLAAEQEGFRFVGIEVDEAYLEIARGRLLATG